MITLIAAYGNYEKHVEIINHFGGGGTYYIYVDRAVCGTINFQLGEWHIYLNESANDELTTEDRMILIDLVIIQHG